MLLWSAKSRERMDGSDATLITPESVIGIGNRGSNPPISTQGGDGSLLSQVSSNPFFTAGIGLAGLGVLLATAQRGLRRGASMLKRRLLVDVEINNKNESYTWLLQWMTMHQGTQLPGKSTLTAMSTDQEVAKAGVYESLLRRFTPGTRHFSIHTEKTTHANGSVQTHFAFLPGPGRHILRYKNAFLMINRVRDIKSMDIHSGRPWESITLTTLYSQRHVFEDLFAEAHKLAQRATEGRTIVYTARSTSWEPFGEARRKRPIESVILDQGVKERIVADVKGFLASSTWYYQRGIPYRRGYLLHGPPGTGKSSFIQALAGELDYNIAILNLSERGLTDDRLNLLLTVMPRRTLVLLEDADAAFTDRRQTDSDGYRGANVTFSGLLNALDGVGSAEERVLFLTTNHIERLDAALVRPGRVDMSVRLGEATRWQAGMLWDRFYGDLDQCEGLKGEFLRRLEALGILESDLAQNAEPGKRTSAAALQGLFLYNKGDMEGAIAMAPALVSRPPQ